MPRRVYAASVEIDAPPALVWEVLTDLDRYPEWNPFTISLVAALRDGIPTPANGSRRRPTVTSLRSVIAVRSTLRESDAVDLTVRMARLGRTLEQREHVREVREGERIRWGMKVGAPWLLSGERDQRIEPLAGERSRYTTEDAIAGALAPLVWAIFGPSLEDGFTSMARALKAEAERRA
jgi:hypothetical protein